jgi:hypothetical protein
MHAFGSDHVYSIQYVVVCVFRILFLFDLIHLFIVVCLCWTMLQ